MFWNNVLLKPHKYCCCTVPMRNWNDLTSATEFKVLSLYCTYEELKLKLHTCCNSIILCQLYCTYEELKLKFLFFYFFFSTKVVLYLWGIETSEIAFRKVPELMLYCTYEELKLWILNISKLKIHNVVLYLWGIETFLPWY